MAVFIIFICTKWLKSSGTSHDSCDHVCWWHYYLYNLARFYVIIWTKSSYLNLNSACGWFSRKKKKGNIRAEVHPYHLFIIIYFNFNFWRLKVKHKHTQIYLWNWQKKQSVWWLCFYYNWRVKWQTHCVVWWNQSSRKAEEIHMG